MILKTEAEESAQESTPKRLKTEHSVISKLPVKKQDILLEFVRLSTKQFSSEISLVSYFPSFLTVSTVDHNIYHLNESLEILKVNKLDGIAFQAAHILMFPDSINDVVIATKDKISVFYNNRLLNTFNIIVTSIAVIKKHIYVGDNSGNLTWFDPWNFINSVSLRSSGFISCLISIEINAVSYIVAVIEDQLFYVKNGVVCTILTIPSQILCVSFF